jgi:hypothetical protein
MQLDATEWKVGVGNFLAGVLMVVAVFINHHRPTLLHLQFYEYKPVSSANFIQMAGSSILKPISTRHFPHP